MNNDSPDGLTALEALRQNLDDRMSLMVTSEGGYRFRAYCEFADPAPPESIVHVEGQLGYALPIAYRRFLEHYDGVSLFYPEERIWGFRIYGTEEILPKNAEWREMHDMYTPEWRDTFLACADWMADPDVLVFDRSRPTKEGTDYVILDGDHEYPVAEWRIAAPSFGDWVDRLVVAQGAAYWRWLQF